MAKILNNILCTAMVFLLTFAWAVYCLKNSTLALAVASVVALCGCYLVFAAQKRHGQVTSQKKQVRANIQNFAHFLRYNCDNSALFLSLLCYHNFVAQVFDFDNIIATKSHRTFVAISFEEDCVSPVRLQKVIVEAKRQNCESLLVFCNSYDNALCAICNSQLPTKFADIKDTYNLFEHAELLPKLPEKCLPKQHLFAQIAFSKKRFGWYLGAAFFTLVTAFFSLLKVYLLVWSTLLFALAIYSLLNRRYNRTESSFTLE